MYHIDSDRQMITFMGIQLFEFGKGEYMTLTPRNKPWSEEEGTHGAVIRVGVPAQAYDAKLSILKGAVANGFISTQVGLDLTTGQGVGPMIVKDLDGASLITSPVSYFYPLEIKLSTDPLMNEWEGFVVIPKIGGWHEGAARILAATV
jgi:hypothetical protein